MIFHEECLHGHAAIRGTSFPQPIGLAATFDPELVESLFALTAAEARLRGTHQALTPVLTWRAIHAGAGWKRRTVKIRTCLRAWASPRCAAFRAMGGSR